MCSFSLAAALLALLTGCTKHDDDTGDGDTLDTFTVLLELGWPQLGWVPLEGATVAFDDARGQRVEVVTGADGAAPGTPDALGPDLALLPVPAIEDHAAIDDGLWEILMAAPPPPGAAHYVVANDALSNEVLVVGNVHGDTVRFPAPPSTIDTDALRDQVQRLTPMTASWDAGTELSRQAVGVARTLPPH